MRWDSGWLFYINLLEGNWKWYLQFVPKVLFSLLYSCKFKTVVRYIHRYNACLPISVEMTTRCNKIFHGQMLVVTKTCNLSMLKFMSESVQPKIHEKPLKKKLLWICIIIVYVVNFLLFQKKNWAQNVWLKCHNFKPFFSIPWNLRNWKGKRLRLLDYSRNVRKRITIMPFFSSVKQ